jgi:D-alanyl-D-alanine carboxypeptidase
MKFLAFLVAMAVSALTQAQILPQAPTVAAKSWLLLDYATGQALASYNPDERVEPASLTKLMTAYVVLGALREKKLAPEQAVPVSERAWKAAGSRMFIEPKRPVSVDELMRGMIVQSGNDASVALAEATAGSEEAFAQLMNREAQRLGLKSTHFVNATGLPDPQHYSTARDLGTLAAALIRDYPEHYPLYALREYTYNRISQANRNRLLWLDPAVDGVKTGHTESAGFCLVASAKRGPRRLLSVVMGTASDGHAHPGIAEAAQLRLPVLRRGQALRQGPGGVAAQGLEGRAEHRQGRLPRRFHAVPAQGHGREAQGQPGQPAAADGAGAEGPAHRHAASSRSTTSPSANIRSWRWRPCRWPASSAGPGTRCVCGSSDDHISRRAVHADRRGEGVGDGPRLPLRRRRLRGDPGLFAAALPPGRAPGAACARRSTASASPIRSARRSGRG